MLDENIHKIIRRSRKTGWVLEPDAKAIMQLKGLDIPDFILTRSLEKADEFLKNSSGSIVIKAVSKKILHKTEHQAVVTRIVSRDRLEKEMKRLKKIDGCETILVEQMVQGLELIIGAKNDFQFGPVIVFGIGGTCVEVYNDTAIRMAPLEPADVLSMIQSLKAKDLITGHRGRAGINLEALTRLMVNFSQFIIEFEKDMESVDLNPVICTMDKCVIADARIILTAP